MIQIIDGSVPERIDQVRQLLEEYASWIEISLCFQGFDKELAGLPGDYATPKGRLFLALEEEQLAGCIALRPLSETVCEMKRLYVRPEFRGRGLGKQLANIIVEAGRDLGYEYMRLDTLPNKMDQALAMYRRLGFKEIEPYYPNPVAGATFMELELKNAL
jgi:ribosomal protein S18 acetylase RimI-like enzyme